jgi:hypothetical protein
MEDLGILRSNDLPAPRWSQLKALLDRLIEVTEKTHLRHARPAMQKDQKRIREALAPDHHPLIEPAQTKIADFRDATRKDLAV